MLNVYRYFDDYKSLQGIEKYKQKLISSGNTEDMIGFAKDVIKGRWDEAEPNIMKDPLDAYYYARDIIKGRWPQAEPVIIKACPVAYAKGIIKGRWIEAEPVIMQNPHNAAEYAEDVLSKDPEWCNIPGHENGRWPEAEPIIRTDKRRWGLYKKRFGLKLK